jgi:hypothetical protein
MTRNMSNIFLVALAKTSDLKNYGHDAILKMIVNDLQSLETNGIEVCTVWQIFEITMYIIVALDKHNKFFLVFFCLLNNILG